MIKHLILTIDSTVVTSFTSRYSDELIAVLTVVSLFSVISLWMIKDNRKRKKA